MAGGWPPPPVRDPLVLRKSVCMVCPQANNDLGDGTAGSPEPDCPFPDLLDEAQWDRARAELGLTRREVEVFRLIVRGLSNAELCHALFISHDTLRTHLKSIYRKAGAKDRVSLILNVVHRYCLGRDVD